MADHTTRINVEVNDAPIKSLKSQLRETIDLMGTIPSESEVFQQLVEKAATLKDKMAEVNEQVAVFSTGSNYEIVSNSLGEIGAGLRDLDFDQVTRGAKLFAESAKKITFKDAIGSLKQMGGAFVSIGKTILTNPLFLIVAVVGAIVLAIGKLLDEMGILDDIMKVVGDAIGYVIQQLKDMLDWLGLTSYAAEDAAAKQVEAQQRIVEAYDRTKERVSDNYDHEIRLAKIAGQETTSLERSKQMAIEQTSLAQIEALKSQLAALKASGEVTKEKADEIRKAITDLRKNIREAKQEIEVIDAQEVADNKAKQQKIASQNASYAKSSADTEKQYNADRLNAKRAIQDAGLALMEEGQQKELLVNRTKFEREIEDVKANTKLLASEKLALSSSLEQNEYMVRKEINQKYLDEINEAVRLSNEAKAKSNKDLLVVEESNLEELGGKRKKSIKDDTERQNTFKEATLDLSSSILAGLAANLKQGSKAAKAVAVGQAAIDTYRAATAAFATTFDSPITVAFPAAPFLAAGAAVAMGLANVRKILATDNSGNSTPSVSGGGGASAQMPNFGSASSQPQQTPNLNLNTSPQQNAGGSVVRERVVVLDYTDIQDKDNQISKIKSKVSLA